MARFQENYDRACVSVPAVARGGTAYSSSFFTAGGWRDIGGVGDLSSAGARQPDVSVVAPAVQLATAKVFIEKGDQIPENVCHGPTRSVDASRTPNADRSGTRTLPPCGPSAYTDAARECDRRIGGRSSLAGPCGARLKQ